MSYGITASSHVDKITASVWSESSRTAIISFGGRHASSNLHVPRHVAEATAEAFNRAMQVMVKGDGALAYATDAGLFHITTDAAKGVVWLAQHDEITGDSDPAWMFAAASSLEALQDAVDDQVAEHLAEAEIERTLSKHQKGNCDDLQS